MNPPETEYAQSGDLHIAYQVVGTGPIDVVLVDQWFSHMDGLWDVPPLAGLIERLASFSRVITFDQRGVGLSDPVPTSVLPSIEEWMDDLRAVMDAAGSEQAAVVAGLAAGFMATVFAATHPDRASSLVLVDTFSRFVAGPDYPWGAPPEERTRRMGEIQAEWGRGLMLHQFAPSMAADARLQEQWARYERQSASPGSTFAMMTMLYDSDIRHVLPTVRVPTLVIARGEAERIPPHHSRYIAEHIPRARYVELPGVDNLMWAGDQETTVAEIQEFITGVRPVPAPDRVLATVLFTDIVRSTDLAAELGDHRWRGLLAEHDRIVRRQLDRFRGREVKTTGDGFLATFDGPARAIRCAGAIRDGVRALEIDVRAGLHTGEVELLSDDVGGIAVHIGARVSALAGPSEVLVSSTVKDLVAGSGIEFEDRGVHELKGVPGEWRLYAVSHP